MPPLPDEWHSHSAMIPAAGFDYGGDFFVADRAGDRLQLVLVDVCGHGDAAVPEAVQFAGALRGLVHAVPAEQVMGALNAYLLDLSSEESFTTAVQVIIELTTGSYQIRSAGHPPVLHWDPSGRWRVDNARGTALGVTATPDFDLSNGVLRCGEAFLFYTDGVVESREADIDDGIEWLRRTAAACVGDGFAGLADRVLAQVPRGEDDRALLVLGRGVG
jgi:serine phosphatase RsbU (regulator of sigma subunit)